MKFSNEDTLLLSFYLPYYRKALDYSFNPGKFPLLAVILLIDK